MPFLVDAWDFVSDKVEDAWDATGAHVVDAGESAIRAIPGGDELIEVTGDFANSAVGTAVLRAIATMYFGTIAWTIGPQLASVTFALPGIMKGDRFDEAWLTEFKYRVEKTAEILGPGIIDAFGSQLTDTLKRMFDEYGIGELVEEGVQELAKRYNIREDVAAFAMALWNRVQLPPRDAFDPITGRMLRSWEASPAAVAAKAAQSSREYRALYGAREHELLYGDRERAALAVAYAPAEEKTSSTGTVALAVVAVAAIGIALAWRKL